MTTLKCLDGLQPKNDGKPVTLLLLIKGNVQGVNFRQFLVDEASKVGVEGWARNLSDKEKSVEAFVTGDFEKVDKFVRIAGRGRLNHRTARVDSCDMKEASIDLLKKRRRGEKFSRL
jgi:acylphosphatase